jgi:hypothetical protein
MKNVIFLVISFLFLTAACSDDDSGMTATPSGTSIVGEWQLVETFDGGSPQPIRSVSNGNIINFTADNIYEDSSYSCEGIYTISNENNLTIDFPCSPNLEYRANIELEDNFEILFIRIQGCIEGCYSKYKRVNN